MAIANVVGRGFGPGASIPFVVTRGFSIGDAIIAPPNASLTTRGYGADATIGGIVTRFYGIGAAQVSDGPPQVSGGPGGSGAGSRSYRSALAYYRRKLKKEEEEEYREELERLAGIVGRLASQQEKREERAPYVDSGSRVADFEAEFSQQIHEFVSSLVAARDRRIAEQIEQLTADAEEAARIEAELQDEEDAVLTLLLH